jgi:hypothetical protein
LFFHLRRPPKKLYELRTRLRADGFYRDRRDPASPQRRSGLVCFFRTVACVIGWRIRINGKATTERLAVGLHSRTRSRCKQAVPAGTIFAASGISLAAPKKSSVRRGTGQLSGKPTGRQSTNKHFLPDGQQNLHLVQGGSPGFIMPSHCSHAFQRLVSNLHLMEKR